VDAGVPLSGEFYLLSVMVQGAPGFLTGVREPRVRNYCRISINYGPNK
jgi:hypothetical protein